MRRPSPNRPAARPRATPDASLAPSGRPGAQQVLGFLQFLARRGVPLEGVRFRMLDSEAGSHGQVEDAAALLRRLSQQEPAQDLDVRPQPSIREELSFTPRRVSVDL